MSRTVRIGAWRLAGLGAWLLVAAVHPSLRADQPAASCGVAGTIVSGRTPLPGVVVAVVDATNRTIDASASSLNGTFALDVPQPGRYTLRTEFAAFAPIVRDITIEPSNCHLRVDLSMTLASRAPGVPAPQAAADASAATLPNGQTASAGRGASSGGVERGRGRAGGRPASPPFQSLALRADDDALARVDEDGVASDAATVLPRGFSPDTSSESVAAIGSANANESVFGNRPDNFAERFGSVGEPGAAAAPAGPGGAGGFGGPGGFGGRGGFAAGGGARLPGGGLGRGNHIRGSIYQSLDSSALDSAPYALNGQPTNKPDYLQQRFGVTLGGPLVIPKIVNSPRTFFFLNYTGNHSTNPFDAYANVPTLAERAGDLSALDTTIVDPVSGQPFANNHIPPSRFDPSAQALLALIPQPNQSGSEKNFHTVTTTASALDDVNLRFVRIFGAAAARGTGSGGRAAGTRGGPTGRAGVSNLNLTVHFRHADNSNTNVFPGLGGTSTLTALDVPAGYSFGKAGLFHQLRFDLNRQHTETQNLFAFDQNVAANAGVLGASPDPFDWGAPNLSFSSLGSLNDVNPSTRTDRTMSAGDTITKTIDAHTVRFGGDYRDIRAESRLDRNARGSFVFTGLYSGSDFSDFLLGLPQQATLQYGPGPEEFRSRSWDLFVQDDWRATESLTINAGLRYEYYSPVSEASNRLVTLDVAPGFAAAVPVEAGGTGPFAGALPVTIVHPFRTGFAPRTGLAWRPKQGTVVRAGYSINYNASVYQSIAQQLASQPPFAVVNTALATPARPLTLESALENAAPGASTNTYAVDPDYRLGFVQIWNVDLQRDVSHTVQLGVGYTGTKGGNLDLLRAPNRGPDGLLAADVAPFIYESSGAESIMNALTLRLRKRLTKGLAAGGTYTLSKAIDDASSIAGAGGTVAQNDRDLAAERGLSTFDQRHRFSADFAWELPFGATKTWFEDGIGADLLGNWTFNGTLTLASGTPFTPRVLGAFGDVAGGVNGTLRANYNGQPIAVSDPTTLAFFNTAAFSVPAPGTFGNAGRDIIIGPGTSSMTLGVTRSIAFGQTRSMTIQVLANNVFNTVQFASIDTVVNSPTFGQVTAVRPMRRVQLLLRFRL